MCFRLSFLIVDVGALKLTESREKQRRGDFDESFANTMKLLLQPATYSRSNGTIGSDNGTGFGIAREAIVVLAVVVVEM